MIMRRSKVTPTEENKLEEPKKTSPVKIAALVIGSAIGVAHIGVLGHLISLTEKYANRPQYPAINIPTGEYSSWDVNVGRDGYSIKYKANDPKVLSSERSLEVDATKKGIFGGGSEKRSEYRRDEYTMDGTRNVGGAVDDEGKQNAKSEECIRADAGARSQGAIAGASIATGAVAPVLSGIPYVGWLAAGWAVLLGQKAGSSLGSEIGSVFNDC
jgi:hypothetical protein